MVKKTKMCTLKIRLFVIFLAVISVSIILMPFTVDDNTFIRPCISGLLFWIGVVGVIVNSIVVSRDRKKDRSFRRQNTKQKQLGLIHFFQNKPAVVFDILMFISVAAFIILSIYGYYYLQFICLSVFVFTFGMHCMLNGLNYIYLKYMIGSGSSK